MYGQQGEPPSRIEQEAAMARSMNWTATLKIALALVVAAVILVIALPAMASLAIVGRLAVPVLMVVGAVVALAIPSVRRSLLDWDDEELEVHGVKLAEGLMMHRGHAWVRSQGKVLGVGADDLVQRTLGPADAIQLPSVGTEVKQGDPLFTVHRGKREVTVRAPVTGRVTRANARLATQPALMQADPYGAGWAVQLEPTDSHHWAEKLLEGSSARAWFRCEVDRLLAAISPEPMPVMQDGGPVVADLHNHIDDEAWQRVQACFFEDVK
jgi:glycine cleavage system H protein